MRKNNFKKVDKWVLTALLYSSCRACLCNKRVIYLNSMINHYIQKTIISGEAVSAYTSCMKYNQIYSKKKLIKIENISWLA